MVQMPQLPACVSQKEPPCQAVIRRGQVEEHDEHHDDQLCAVDVKQPRLERCEKAQFPGQPPDDQSTFVPGVWVWRDTRYMWRPGTWVRMPADWVWQPSHYVWTPAGCLFVDGYWDHPLDQRGLLYAPVVVPQNVLVARQTIVYEPTYVVRPAFLTGALFVRSALKHYFFGDYFEARYRTAGYLPWFDYRIGRAAYDPIYSYYRVHRPAAGQRVPCGQAGARQRRGLGERQVLGHRQHRLAGHHRILGEQPIEGTAELVGDVQPEASVQPAREDLHHHPGTDGEVGHVQTDLSHDPGTLGQRHHVRLDRQDVVAAQNEPVTEPDRGRSYLDEHVIGSWYRYVVFLQAQPVEAAAVDRVVAVHEPTLRPAGTVRQLPLGCSGPPGERLRSGRDLGAGAGPGGASLGGQSEGGQAPELGGAGGTP